jgi:glycerol-3-phosphate O-acyltransferase
LAEYALGRIGAVIPVTPVPLAAVSLLSFGQSVVPKARVLERMDEIRDQLREGDAKIVRTELPVTEVWQRAWLMLSMRRLVVAQGADLVILPGERPLLEYYANSIRHLLPPALRVAFSPAEERDETLPRLATREEMDIMTKEMPARRLGGSAAGDSAPG